MNDLEEIRSILRQHLSVIRQRFRITHLRIFGSYARGQQSSKSDLDLLIGYDKPPTLWMVLELKTYLEDILGMQVDVVTERGLKKRIRDRVLAEAIDV
jgi:predicted nucleotidyltransferase